MPQNVKHRSLSVALVTCSLCGITAHGCENLGDAASTAHGHGQFGEAENGRRLTTRPGKDEIGPGALQVGTSGSHALVGTWHPIEVDAFMQAMMGEESYAAMLAVMQVFTVPLTLVFDEDMTCKVYFTYVEDDGIVRHNLIHSGVGPYSKEKKINDRSDNQSGHDQGAWQTKGRF